MPPQTDGPAPPSAEELGSARERLAGRVRVTPLLEVEVPGQPGAARVLLKLELTQHSGSFKARGALNALLAGAPAERVVAASGGNHGAAVAWAARAHGVAADIFVPSATPRTKTARIESYGASVHLIEGQYADAFSASLEHAARTGAKQIHAYDEPAVVAGQSTVGSELIEQCEEVACILVPCGGGGLYAGVALATLGRAVVVPVEPAGAPTLSRAVEAGHAVAVAVDGVAVDSLGARRAGAIATAVALETKITPVLVSDRSIVAAQRWLWESARVAAEPGGATALAAVLDASYRLTDGATTVVVISGSNGGGPPNGGGAARHR